MEIKPGLSALVTGGASGIGKALSLALGQRGVFVTIVDISQEKGEESVVSVQKVNAKFHRNLGLALPSAMFIKCDVSNSREVDFAFEKHFATYGGLDICINNAGIISSVPFYEDQTDGTGSWHRVVDVNLNAVIYCTQIAIKTMKAAKKPCAIINMASASGLYPFYQDPIYAASKGGVVLFTRSLARLRHQGIRVNVLCPEFVETEMVLTDSSKFIDFMGGFISMEMIIKGVFELIGDQSKAGECLWITNRRGMEYWPTPAEKNKYLVNRTRKNIFPIMPFMFSMPESFEKIVVHTLSQNFHEATNVIRTPLKLPIKSHCVLVKIIFVGVNASDVNFASGRYFNGDDNVAQGRLPIDAGFEAVGIIVAVNDSVTDLKVGTPAALLIYGCYAEFVMVPSKHILRVAKPDPEVVAMLSSGLTASIALHKALLTDSGNVVLVTAAAGGTGQFSVQLAKLAGKIVVATCGGNDKAVLLNDLGVDRVIDYKAEDIKTVLKEEFPKGVDIVYESVGGKMFELCLNALAVHGKLIVIGMISQYKGEHGWKPLNYTGLCEKILAKSQTVTGFFLPQHRHLWQEHLDKLFHLHSSGKLKVAVDPRKFVGLHSVADAVDHLHSGKSLGKVVVCIDPTFPHQYAKL